MSTLRVEMTPSKGATTVSKPLSCSRRFDIGLGRVHIRPAGFVVGVFLVDVLPGHCVLQA